MVIFFITNLTEKMKQYTYAKLQKGLKTFVVFFADEYRLQYTVVMQPTPRWDLSITFETF